MFIEYDSRNILQPRLILSLTKADDRVERDFMF